MAFEAQKDDAAASRLVSAGRALLARGDANFPLVRLCAEAGVSLAEFRQSFATKAVLMQALSAEPEAPQADPWLERRLRVFERALNALEQRAETERRAHGLALARLEERLTALDAMPAVLAEKIPEEALAPKAEEAAKDQSEDQPEEKPEADEEEKVKAAPIFLAPLESAPVVKADAEFLDAARRAAQRAREAEPPKRRRVPRRTLITAVLAMAVLTACAVLSLCLASRPSAAEQGVAHRAAAVTPLTRLMARADGGEPRAQTALAFAYLRGQGVARDGDAAARWAEAAARQGDGEAQYLFACLARDGIGVARDPVLSFRWFARAAAGGNRKAMHNLAIAYAEGQGTPMDEAAAAYWFGQAAARGYLDSAFDLAVLYERGAGVAQDVKAALYWYGVAAQGGDAQAAKRAQILAADASL